MHRVYYFFLINFRRVTFVKPRNQAHFSADDVIISLAVVKVRKSQFL